MKERLLYYYVTEISSHDPEHLFDTADEALDAAKAEWETAGEEYDEDLTWIKTIRYRGKKCGCQTKGFKESTHTTVR